MAAYRPAEAGGELEQALAVLARRSPARLPLAGLPAPDAAALISSVYGGPVEEHIVQALADRTGGNPFYLRESAKLLASEGALVAVSEVPEGVRDVLRRRLARLPRPPWRCCASPPRWVRKPMSRYSWTRPIPTKMAS